MKNEKRSARKPGEQLYLDGTEPPKNKKLETALYAWLEAKDEQKSAADATKIKHEKLLEIMAEANIDRYPYLDAYTGKKRIVVAAKIPKARTMTAPSRKQEGRENDLARDDKKSDDKVESRRVPRHGSHDRISDPFAATRAGMDGVSDEPGH